MRKGWSKTMVVLAALALVALAAPSAFANGGGESTATAQAVTPVDWFINLTWYKYGGDWGKDKFSQEVEKKFGLKLNFVLPAQEGGQQISTMIASGTLTDIVTVESWLNYRSKMAKAGLLWGYDDLIAKYDPSFGKIVRKDIMDWYREADGKSYGLPNFAYSKYDLKPGQRLRPNAGFTLRSDLYAAIGKPPITTPDTLLAALQKVKDQAGTYQGKSVIPLELYEFNDQGNSSVMWLSQYFATRFEDPSGNWVYDITQDKYYEALKFLNEAYRRGLISPENLTDNRDQINQKVASGRVFAMMTAPQDFVEQERSLYRADNKAQYDGFVVRNYENEDPVLSDISGFGWLTTSVAKTAKAPDKITRFLHWLNSDEGQWVTFWGWKDETYTVGKDGRVAMTDAFNAASKDGTAGARWGIGFMLQQNWLWAMNKAPIASDPESLALDEDRQKTPSMPYSWDGRLRGIKSNPDDPRANDMQTLANKINLFWGKQLPKIIIAGSEADAHQIWQDTIAQMKGMGLDTLIAYNNEGFQATKKAMSVTFAWPTNK